jgi:hypothetical protein
MKNPFNKPLTASELMGGWGFDHDEAEWFADVMAQHDKLVDACRFAKAQIRKGSPKKALPVLAALLAEEKDNGVHFKIN